MSGPAPLGVRDLLACANLLRTTGTNAETLEDVASAVVTQVHDYLLDKRTGRPVLPLVRMYLTRRCGELPPELQDFARVAGVDAPVSSEVTCLALLASAGEEPAWNDRRMSRGHKALPLQSVQALRRLPMVARLVEQLGLEASDVLRPEPSQYRHLSDRNYDIFYVDEALDSPYIPDQAQFVIPYGIRSVVGFGGVLPDGALYAVVMFSSVPLPASTNEAFAAMSLSVKIALLPHVAQPTFVGHIGPRRSSTTAATLRRRLLEAENLALHQLLDVRSKVVDSEGAAAEQDLSRYEAHAVELRESREALAASEARKAAIVEGALDCIVGMDSAGRVTEWNHAAEQTFGWSRHEIVGQLLSETIIPYSMRARHTAGLERFQVTGRGALIGRRIEVQALRRDGSEVPVELAVTCVRDADPPLFNGYIRDITAAKQAQREREIGQERLARIARTLQASLLPPLLPDIDGFELAAAFRPHGDGYEVGGDFYDAFELRNGRWALTLGDVSGKGSEAAAVTGLARHTIRAAAMKDEHPSSVLSTLNEAVHRHHLAQFCTAAFVTLDPVTGDISLALGGHPHPLLVPSRGNVEPVGRPGNLLGPFEDWEGETVSMRLHPGEALVLYSDGVTEARNGKDFFGQRRLEESLTRSSSLTADQPGESGADQPGRNAAEQPGRSTAGPNGRSTAGPNGRRAAEERGRGGPEGSAGKAHAGRSAAEMTRALEDDVLAFAGSLSDDLAVLCVKRAQQI